MIKKYNEDGATIAQIAVMTGVGQTTVKAWLKDCRVDSKTQMEIR